MLTWTLFNGSTRLQTKFKRNWMMWPKSTTQGRRRMREPFCSNCVIVLFLVKLKIKNSEQLYFMTKYYSEKLTNHKTGVINDPLGQTHSLASSEHCFRLKFVLFSKVGTDADVQMDDTCKNNDPYRP